MEPLKSAWVRYRTCVYLGGRGLSWGTGPEPIVPKAAQDSGRWSLAIDWQRHPSLAICDRDYSALAPRSLDHVFVGPRLETVNEHAVLLRMLTEKLRAGGHFVYHGRAAALGLDTLRSMLLDLGGWQEKDTYLRDGQLVGVWKLLDSRSKELRPAAPRAPKRACISRYGAIGDMLMVTPLIQALHEDGYEVTVNTTPYCAEVLKHNPHLGNLLLQERDIIPNSELGAYWDEWRGDYQAYINLSESIEGTLLKVEGRREFYTTQPWRHVQVGSTNYYEHTLKLGGYEVDPAGTVVGHPTIQCRPQLYLSKPERTAAAWVRKQLPGKWVVLWSLKGSSHHKQWPFLRPFLEEWLPSHPQAHVILSGSEVDRPLGWEGPQVTNAAGQMPLREAFALTQTVDLIVGPESALINAAACWDTPKLVLRSHSTCENLCKHFTNHVCLQATSPCTPCHQLHYELDSCPLVTIEDTSTAQAVWKGPRCCAELSPDLVGRVLETAFQAWASRPTTT